MGVLGAVGIKDALRAMAIFAFVIIEAAIGAQQLRRDGQPAQFISPRTSLIAGSEAACVFRWPARCAY